MKNRILSISLILALSVLVLCSCAASAPTSSTKQNTDPKVLKAIDVLVEYWAEDYEQSNIDDKYLEIQNTRIIYLKDEIDAEKLPRKGDWFDGIDYVVEFELLSNFFNSTPHYFNSGIYDSVVFYKDGSTKVQSCIFNTYRSSTFSADFTPIIESIEDLGNQYDQVLKIK